MMVTDKTLVHGTDKDPRLTIRAGAALIHASEDNVDQIMIDLEQSRKSVAQLKDTLKKKRDESNKLKRKFEDMLNEVKSSKAELQSLQADKMSLEVAIGKTGTNAHDNLAKLQQEYQDLKTERDGLNWHMKTFIQKETNCKAKLGSWKYKGLPWRT